MPSWRTGLARTALGLTASGALAQALPLLLGPWLTRLFSPAQFGQFTVFATAAASIGVVACARYEFALPMVAGEADARDLMALCLRILVVVTLITTLPAVLLWAAGQGSFWLLLPAFVMSYGASQWLTLWATRAERFRGLSAARVTQYGGAAVLQAAGGMFQGGVWALILGPVAASTSAALLWLRHPQPLGGWVGLWRVPRQQWLGVARRYRDFPMLNTPHAFLGTLQDTLSVFIIIAATGEASAGFWGLALRYVKAPASIVGFAVSQALYPRLSRLEGEEARSALREVMSGLGLAAIGLVVVLFAAGPTLFAWIFGERWRAAGELARALSPYVGVHFVASPLAVTTMAWGQQRWALRMALFGQAAFLCALAGGLLVGGLLGGAWAVSAVTVVYFCWYFVSLDRRVPTASAVAAI